MSEEKIRKNQEEKLEKILYKIRGKVAYITINTKMNTVNIDTAKKLVEKLCDADKNPKVRCVVLKSTGKRIFSAGFDLAIFQQGLNEKTVENVLTYGREVSRTIFFMKKPVIAQIQGSAIGLGCIMALSCDFRFAARREDLFFRLPEIDIKIFPATGPTVMSIHVLGVPHAKEMLYTGRKVFLNEFDKWGAITKIVEPEQLANKVKKFARELVKKTPKLLQSIKPAVNLITYEKAKSWYDLENEFARYYFDGFFGKDRDTLEEFLKKMWSKYGNGMP